MKKTSREVAESFVKQVFSDMQKALDQTPNLIDEDVWGEFVVLNFEPWVKEVASVVDELRAKKAAQEKADSKPEVATITATDPTTKVTIQLEPDDAAAECLYIHIASHYPPNPFVHGSMRLLDVPHIHSEDGERAEIFSESCSMRLRESEHRIMGRDRTTGELVISDFVTIPQTLVIPKVNRSKLGFEYNEDMYIGLTGLPVLAINQLWSRGIILHVEQAPVFNDYGAVKAICRPLTKLDNRERLVLYTAYRRKPKHDISRVKLAGRYGELIREMKLTGLVATEVWCDLPEGRAGDAIVAFSESEDFRNMIANAGESFKMKDDGARAVRQDEFKSNFLTSLQSITDASEVQPVSPVEIQKASRAKGDDELAKEINQIVTKELGFLILDDTFGPNVKVDEASQTILEFISRNRVEIKHPDGEWLRKNEIEISMSRLLPSVTGSTDKLARILGRYPKKLIESIASAVVKSCDLAGVKVDEYEIKIAIKILCYGYIQQFLGWSPNNTPEWKLLKKTIAKKYPGSNAAYKEFVLNNAFAKGRDYFNAMPVGAEDEATQIEAAAIRLAKDADIDYDSAILIFDTVRHQGSAYMGLKSKLEEMAKAVPGMAAAARKAAKKSGESPPKMPPHVVKAQQIEDCIRKIRSPFMSMIAPQIAESAVEVFDPAAQAGRFNIETVKTLGAFLFTEIRVATRLKLEKKTAAHSEILNGYKSGLNKAVLSDIIEAAACISGKYDPLAAEGYMNGADIRTSLRHKLAPIYRRFWLAVLPAIEVPSYDAVSGILNYQNTTIDRTTLSHVENLIDTNTFAYHWELEPRQADLVAGQIRRIFGDKLQAVMIVQGLHRAEDPSWLNGMYAPTDDHETDFNEVKQMLIEKEASLRAERRSDEAAAEKLMSDIEVENETAKAVSVPSPAEPAAPAPISDDERSKKQQAFLSGFMNALSSAI